jgi:hypothetical protein
MQGQEDQGAAGRAWSPYGAQASSPAWGGAAAQLQTPQSTVREAMLLDEAQVCCPGIA